MKPCIKLDNIRYTYNSYEITVFFLFLAIIFTCFFIYIFSVHTNSVTVQQENGTYIPISLPLKEHSISQNTQIFHIQGTLSLLSPQKLLTIIPDDCITQLSFNNKPINLINNIHGSSCDFISGFTVNIQKDLHNGDNAFTATIVDHGGWYGLSIDNTLTNIPFFILTVLLLSEILLLVYMLLRSIFHFSRLLSILFIGGLLIRIMYLSYTPYSQRTHDVLEYGGHLDYIRYIANHFQLPPPNMDTGWEYHQAPLYYIIAASIYREAQLLSINSFFLFSFFLYCLAHFFLPLAFCFFE